MKKLLLLATALAIAAPALAQNATSNSSRTQGTPSGAGDPVHVGCKYQAAPPTLTDGNHGDVQCDNTGAIKVSGSFSGTSSSNIAQVGGNTVLAGNGVTGTGSLRVTLASDTSSNTNPLLFNQSQINGVALLTGNGTAGTGAQRVTIASDNTAFSVNATNLPATSGGTTTIRLVGATNGVIKASAGQLYGGTLLNSNAAVRYLQVYNKTTAGTLSTDTPAITIPLQPNVPTSFTFADLGGVFTTGISWQFTTDDVAIPTTAGAATDIHGYVTFK